MTMNEAIVDKKKKPTKRQQEILDFIAEYQAKHGMPPCQSDVKERFEFKSPHSVSCHIKALAKKGLLTYQPGKPRSISIINPHITVVVSCET